MVAVQGVLRHGRLRYSQPADDTKVVICFDRYPLYPLEGVLKVPKGA